MGLLLLAADPVENSKLSSDPDAKKKPRATRIGMKYFDTRTYYLPNCRSCVLRWMRTEFGRLKAEGTATY